MHTHNYPNSAALTFKKNKIHYLHTHTLSLFLSFSSQTCKNKEVSTEKIQCHKYFPNMDLRISQLYNYNNVSTVQVYINYEHFC